MLDICLKITGTKGDVRSALETLGFSIEMLRRNFQGQIELAEFNKHVAVNFIPNLITQFGTYDEKGKELTAPVFAGPHLMIRFMSKEAVQKAKQRIIEAGGLPPGLERVAAPATISWAGS